VIARTLNTIMLESDPRVVGSNLSQSNWLFSNKTTQNRRIDVEICKFYDFLHQTIELVENHRFYVSKSWKLRFRSLSKSRSFSRSITELRSCSVLDLARWKFNLDFKFAGFQAVHGLALWSAIIQASNMEQVQPADECRPTPSDKI
jgi:hypothetical protein